MAVETVLFDLSRSLEKKKVPLCWSMPKACLNSYQLYVHYFMKMLLGCYDYDFGILLSSLLSYFVYHLLIGNWYDIFHISIRKILFSTI